MLDSIGYQVQKVRHSNTNPGQFTEEFNWDINYTKVNGVIVHVNNYKGGNLYVGFYQTPDNRVLKRVPAPVLEKNTGGNEIFFPLPFSIQDVKTGAIVYEIENPTGGDASGVSFDVQFLLSNERYQ
jgi:hypothetical protein